MSYPQAAALLLSALAAIPLAACDDKGADMDRVIAFFTGQLYQQQQQLTNIQSLIEQGQGSESSQDSSSSSQPPTAGLVVVTEPSSSSASSLANASSSSSSSVEVKTGPAYGEYGYTGPLPCTESRFRVLTCEQGQWHWLDANMGWAT